MSLSSEASMHDGNSDPSVVAVLPVSVETIDLQPPEAGTETVIDLEIQRRNLSILGIRKWITEKRLKRTEGRIEALEQSADIHKVAALTSLEGRNVKQTTKKEKGEIPPRTFLQRRQSLRADYRVRNNMRKAIDNSRLELIYGTRPVVPSWEKDASMNVPKTKDGVTVPIINKQGEFEEITIKPRSKNRVRSFFDELKHDRKLPRQERPGMRASRQYLNTADNLRGRVQRVEKSTEGNDIPGRVISLRVNMKHTKADKLRENLREITELEKTNKEERERKKKRTQERKTERQTNRVTRKQERVAEGKTLKQRGQKAILQTRKAYDTRVTGASIKNRHEASKQEEASKEKSGRQNLVKVAGRARTILSREDKKTERREQRKTEELERLKSRMGGN